MKHKYRPHIGITKPESKRMNVQFLAMWLAVWLGGGRPIVLSAGKPDPAKTIHGLILGGGTDVFPGLFHKDPIENYQYDRPRDEMEIKWLKIAEEDQIPVFAICRGAQLMNVVNGGSLHLNIGEAYDNADYPETIFGYMFFRKKIHIEKNSLLYKIFKKSELPVNSLHKQSINKVGNNLVVTAREPNGIIQAIERPGHPFYMGVQFHPELLIYQRSFRSFFNRFVHTASTHIVRN